MLDFLKPQIVIKRDGAHIVPNYIVGECEDLMTKGNDFYAIWDERAGVWSTSLNRAIKIIDMDLDDFAAKEKNPYAKIDYIRDSSTGSIDRFKKFLTKQQVENYSDLDNKLTFFGEDIKKEDHVSYILSYPLSDCPTPGYDALMSVIYSPEERQKLEWAIGAVISGDSTKIEKFIVMVGDAGTGKSTVIKIINMLFEKHCSTFDAKALGNPNSSFALEPFKNNPLVAYQDDADLSNIQDNTRLNSLISHECLTVNEKFKSQYPMKFRSFIFLGTNKDVYITDARSGLLRRLIDVEPTGNKLSSKDYFECMNKIKFELGGIATHCLKVYEENKNFYNTYTPIKMMRATNAFYNFIEENVKTLTEIDDGVELSRAWTLYREFTNESNQSWSMNKRQFKNELMVYYKKFDVERTYKGVHYHNLYSGFRYNKMNEYYKEANNVISSNEFSWIKLTSLAASECTVASDYSTFDLECADMPAQYATKNETPEKKWKEVTSKLGDLDTSQLHYVKIPENHIVIDFDLKNEKGEKDFDLNVSAASKFPATYCELSKGGQGIHLHYIYDGDVNDLSRIYDDNIEIKIFKGDSALRRRLTKCNNLPINKISSGLPLKGENKMVNFTSIDNEKAIRTIIKRNLNKEYHGATKPSVDFIFKTLEDAYNNGVKYDVTDMRPAIMAFANNSSHNSEYCVKVVGKMHFKSEEPSEDSNNNYKKTDDIIFFDIEVFPNLFVLVWKKAGKENRCVRLINPPASEVERLLKFKLVGFNNRRYDNHIIYAWIMGYNNMELFKLSQRIINGSNNSMFGEAYNLSYTDIYDFASAGNKKSLKKLEIEMGIHHQELGFKWDEPVSEDKWEIVADYCENDVIATEAAFYYLDGDWVARQILSDLAGMTVNSSTNSLTQKIIFGKEKNPQSEFNYRDLSEPVYSLPNDQLEFLKEVCPEMMAKRHGEENSLLPYFPGYKFENGVSTYMEEKVGEGGKVYAEPGIHCNVALLDVMSMHPHSAIAEVIFGTRFTKVFYQIVYGRVDIKHEAWNELNNILGGKLLPYVEKVKTGELTSKKLADALKTAINAVYGQTAAKYNNPFRDPRNVDNIVAKRGALFMIDLKEEVEKRGFTVAHIKTDSIKIPDATPDIIKFVMDFGKEYGYYFEHEATYDKMCLVNDAVYIAKYATAEKCEFLYGYVPGDNRKHGNEWCATGSQFAQPYVYKSLFSKEELTFDDMCETKMVKTALYLDFNEDLSDGEHKYIFIGKAGQFSPVKSGYGGGILLSERVDKNGDIKYDAVTGSKGYRWKDSEVLRVKKDPIEEIDKTYYHELVSEAINDISKYCDFDWFVGDVPYDGTNIVYAVKKNEFPMNQQSITVKPCGLEVKEFEAQGYCGSNCENYDIKTCKCKKGFELRAEDELPFS